MTVEKEVIDQQRFKPSCNDPLRQASPCLINHPVEGIYLDNDRKRILVSIDAPDDRSIEYETGRRLFKFRELCTFVFLTKAELSSVISSSSEENTILVHSEIIMVSEESLIGMEHLTPHETVFTEDGTRVYFKTPYKVIMVNLSKEMGQ